MATDISKVVEAMRAGGEIHFSDLYKVCEHYFGTPRNKGTSHYIFKTPWPGDPRINIQTAGGKAKRYQVRQVLAAIDKLAEITAKKAAEKAAKAEKSKREPEE